MSFGINSNHNMNFIKLNKYVIISSILLISAIVSNLFLSYYIIPKRYIGVDQLQHFYDMKKWYESGKIPTTSTRFIASRVIDEEYTTARVPGGAYYIFYTLFYKLSSESLLGAKIINLIFNLIIIFIFLFWFYKRFGLMIVSFIAPLILCNGYFVMAITDFWNPNLSLIFGFLLFILLFEYIDITNENNKRRNIIKLSAVFIFPIIAIMAQGHFFVFL
ncbi:MFS_1 multi-domain protein [Brachyspira pilosicoli B2904]|uniref:MFS_1 multi-domain protein n=2 Tax=Brachyspira pilosicoli TaxID=52584 RepID=J9TUZ1_BRAPL|nr:MFS_1 multi-domain protein [Brachyspira pilosicoli B2904]